MMKKTVIETVVKKMLADVHTPVGIYLRLRDRFRDTILLESSDHHAAENSYSFICINAIAGIEIRNNELAEFKLPGQPAEKQSFGKTLPLADLLEQFMQRFELAPAPAEAAFAQGLYGYFSYDAVALFETISFRKKENSDDLPLARYRLYQYVIAVNHYKDELFLLENKINGVESQTEKIETLIAHKDVPVYPFTKAGEETSGITDDDFLQMVDKAMQHCFKGDVFQLVLSRRYKQPFQGDEFNVYRALRHINPSPYLFYFDYGDYKLMGSSPEAQLVISKGEAVMHPIAGTFLRTGNDIDDAQKAEDLLNDPKENAEHVMLVDLARNDLATVCSDVKVSRFKQVQYYSHVIHLVSEVKGKVQPSSNPFSVLFKTFPAGTLSGAPKYRAMQLIDDYEKVNRNFYGGAIGFVGFNGTCNHAIMIRSLLSKNNTLSYQAGAGIVAASKPASELQEVQNKLAALKRSIAFAETIS